MWPCWFSFFLTLRNSTVWLFLFNHHAHLTSTNLGAFFIYSLFFELLRWSHRFYATIGMTMMTRERQQYREKRGSTRQCITLIFFRIFFLLITFFPAGCNSCHWRTAKKTSENTKCIPATAFLLPFHSKYRWYVPAIFYSFSSLPCHTWQRDDSNNDDTHHHHHHPHWRINTHQGWWMTNGGSRRICVLSHRYVFLLNFLY